jgi:hypothetical protein
MTPARRHAQVISLDLCPQEEPCDAASQLLTARSRLADHFNRMDVTG